MTTQFFDTERLRVYHYPIPDFPEDGGTDPLERALFVGFARDDSVVPYPPTPLVTVHLFKRRDAFTWTVAWAETCGKHRRRGFAKETLVGITEHIQQPIYACGATRAGMRLCRSLEDSHELLVIGNSSYDQ